MESNIGTAFICCTPVASTKFRSLFSSISPPHLMTIQTAVNHTGHNNHPYKRRHRHGVSNIDNGDDNSNMAGAQFFATLPGGVCVCRTCMCFDPSGSHYCEAPDVTGKPRGSAGLGIDTSVTFAHRVLSQRARTRKEVTCCVEPDFGEESFVFVLREQAQLPVNAGGWVS